MSMNEVDALRERAKELRCLYRVQAIMSERRQTPAEVFRRVLDVIPDGWQRPATTGARIEYLGRSAVGAGYDADGRTMSEPIRLGGVAVGRIEVSDRAADPPGAFLAEEIELLRTIALRLGEYLEWKHAELLGDRGSDATTHWRWRQTYAEALARAIDPKRFGVVAVYLGGSTQTGDAGPGSDIDLSVLCAGTDPQQRDLAHWLEGWSRGLGELAYQQTGYRFPDGLLNVEWIRERPDPRHRPDLRALTLGPAE